MMPSEVWSSYCERAAAIYRVTSVNYIEEKPLPERNLNDHRKEALKQVLTREEKQVVSLLFGVGGFDRMDMEGVCDVMRMSERQVKVVKVRALRRLKRHQSIAYLKDYLD